MTDTIQGTTPPTTGARSTPAPDVAPAPVTIGAVLFQNARALGGDEAAAKVIDEGMTQWKAERMAEWWDAFDGGIQRVTAEMIRRWPILEGEDGTASTREMLAVVDVSKAVLAETAGVMGIPASWLPFNSEPTDEIEEVRDDPA